MFFQDIMNAEVSDKYVLETANPLATDYLTTREKQLLDTATTAANNASTIQTDVFSMTLKEILANWSNAMQTILIDISRTLTVNEYIVKSNNVYEFITLFINKLWLIFSTNNRLMYVGMTLIFISIVVYFVNIT